MHGRIVQSFALKNHVRRVIIVKENLANLGIEQWALLLLFSIFVLISKPLTTEAAADGRPHCGFPLRPFAHHQDTTSYVRDPFYSWWKSYIYYNLTAFTWIYRGIGSHPDELCHFSILTGPEILAVPPREIYRNGRSLSVLIVAPSVFRLRHL